jgi:uncharacterized membrane protein YgaE (UPF0421/DUF939 family)
MKSGSLWRKRKDVMKFNDKETESKARQEAALQALHDENKRLGLYDYEIGFIEGKAHYKTSRQELREQIEGLERDYELLLAEKKRTWVGLTDEEIDEAIKACNTTDTYKYFRAIEAKLKEKNT